MAEEYLQAAFEIKAACDDISRKLLRWHWEEKPGAHSVDALMKHLAQRQKESPDYYERLPELNGRTGWQQLDTTLCMRVLLDPEKDAARPLDLLGNTPHPAAARRACNAVRMARNEAAHASDRTAAAQAAITAGSSSVCHAGQQKMGSDSESTWNWNFCKTKIGAFTGMMLQCFATLMSTSSAFIPFQRKTYAKLTASQSFARLIHPTKAVSIDL